MLGIAAAVLCSFTYVVAQIYGVGLITSRLTGVAFELGIFLGLGGILVCSFLGGMRAVTWTQVTQYIILIAAYLIPVMWLSVKQTGVPIPQIVYGFQLEKVSAMEKRLIDDPAEIAVREIYRRRAADLAEKLKNPRAALALEKDRGRQEVGRAEIGARPGRRHRGGREDAVRTSQRRGDGTKGLGSCPCAGRSQVQAVERNAPAHAAVRR
jgi:cation/acetate symporter